MYSVIIVSCCLLYSLVLNTNTTTTAKNAVKVAHVRKVRLRVGVGFHHVHGSSALEPSYDYYHIKVWSHHIRTLA